MAKFILYEKARESNKSIIEFINSTNLPALYNGQLKRASSGIVLTIAEGNGRFTQKDKRRFFVMARGSAEECIAIFDILEDEGCINSEESVFRIQSSDYSLIFGNIIRMCYNIGTYGVFI